MTVEKHLELTTTKDLDVKNSSMKDMIYWSTHNIHVFINLICITKSKKLDEKIKNLKT